MAADTRGETTVGAAAAAVPSLQLVAAVSENDVIGRANRLPWRLSADLRHFKELTWGRPILMGRKTYQSIGQALPGRLNLVLTRSAKFNPGDCTVVRTLAEALAAATAQPTLMVIGGAEIYRLCLPHSTRIYLTLVHTRVDGGDAFFTGWRDPRWREISRERHAADAKNELAYSFITLQSQPAAAAT